MLFYQLNPPLLTSLGVPDKRDLSTGSNINPPIFVPNGNNTGGLILEILPARVFGWFTCHWQGRITISPEAHKSFAKASSRNSIINTPQIF